MVLIFEISHLCFMRICGIPGIEEVYENERVDYSWALYIFNPTLSPSSYQIIHLQPSATSIHLKYHASSQCPFKVQVKDLPRQPSMPPIQPAGPLPAKTTVKELVLKAGNDATLRIEIENILDAHDISF
ncbi:hypothetical protein SI65_01976 [Aspergillus cristatus]|uniref:Uncharacterized protein n=1 Tax=Aspergillus cristatus TaxID=573508 RepID=A0A1E3BVD5_ASPCR|nr:hypothetical protein SI65_01906 [Aspergillus cristatus]ODM24386.1 hypothetical protein SI65_01976 [Aspergillus cristatus]